MRRLKSKIAKIVLTKPTNIVEVQRLLQTLIRYKRYISNFNQLTTIFVIMVTYDYFDWNDEAEWCFNIINESLGDLFDFIE